MSIILALLFLVALAVAWVLQLLGLFGTWILVIVAIGYAVVQDEQSRLAIGWETVGVLILLAILGEIVEFVAAAAGVARAGGSRRGAVLALVGSICGGLVGLVVGIPIPVVGSLVAAVLFAAAGAMAGAMLGEAWKGRDPNEQFRIGKAAFWGRILGTLAKTTIASIMAVVAAVALFAS